MTDRPNLVLVTIDSLRADHCGFMGSDRGLTPEMDRMADDGLVYSNAISTGPSTLDAMPGLFTGRDLVSGEGKPRDQLRHHMRARDTLPERLSRLGYETGGFTANPWTSRYFGFDEGFDHFEDFVDGTADADGEGDGSDSTLALGLRLLKNWSREAGMVKSWDSFYDEIIEWTESASEPYFCWIFLVDVHMPYLPPAEFRSTSRASTYAANLWLYLTGHDPGRFEGLVDDRLRSAYEDTIRYTDDRMADLVSDLDDDDPIVTIHADHGEEFGENGLYGHGPSLSEEQVHVPLLVANGPTGRIDEPFSLRRLPELQTALARGDDPESLTRPYVRTRNRDPKVALRGRDWKCSRTPAGDELVAIEDGEVRPLSEPGLADLSASLLDRWRRSEDEREAVAATAQTIAADHPL